ncbi:hypothetical protein EVAR_35256_1 [Eumeta japonica]|uniref:Uncharacterized protein n=1 Tax=Eumeta variegata TaxID=151549 RepID=A0A4C1VDR2_EUMVA|nr:hypothetical protein EVAR_35256_1 [Eumeta japonica]
MSQSTALADAAYASGWECADVRTRRALLVLMTRARRPARLTAGGFTSLSLSSFMAVLSSAYHSVLQTPRGAPRPAKPECRTRRSAAALFSFGSPILSFVPALNSDTYRLYSVVVHFGTSRRSEGRKLPDHPEMMSALPHWALWTRAQGPSIEWGPLVPARLPNDNRYLAQRISNLMTYLARSKAVGRVDMDLLSQHQKEVDYWRNVLKRIVAVVKFLASRGLPFRGDNEILGSPNNGNYLGCVELLSEFDPFLADHLKKFGNPGKDAVSALHGGYKRIIEALITFANDTEQARETRNEALSLSRKMRNLEFIILTEIWSSILERIDKTSNYLQKETITLDVATNVFTSLHDFITNLRDKFDNFESSAKEKNPESDYKDLSQRTRRRSSRQSFFDGSAPSVQLNGKERFNVETFLPIIDTLSVHLK